MGPFKVNILTKPSQHERGMSIDILHFCGIVSVACLVMSHSNQIIINNICEIYVRTLTCS